MGYHTTIDDFEMYVLKSTDTKPPISVDDIIVMEYDTGRRFISKGGVWESYIGNIIGDVAITGTVGVSGGTISIDNTPSINVISEILTKTDTTTVNLADSYYKDEQIVGSIADRSLRQGNMFATGYTWSSVAPNASVVLHIKSGTKPIYLTYEVIGTGLTEYGGYFSPTFTVNGTALSVFKRNMITPYTGTATAYHTPTYSSLGTTAITRFLGTSGNLINKTGGADASQYVILPPNSSVFHVAKNVSTSSQDRMGIYASWFEINHDL